MRTISGALSAMLVVVGFILLPERGDQVGVPTIMVISGITLPILLMAAGTVIFAWNLMREWGH